MEGTGDRWSQAPGLPGAASLCSPCHSQAQLAPRSARAVPKVCFCLDQTSDGGGRGQAGSRAGWCLSAECQGQRLYLRPTPLTLFLRPKPSKNSPQMASLTLLSSVKRGQMVSESPASAREQAPCHPTCKRARSGLHQVGRVLLQVPGAARGSSLWPWVAADTSGCRKCFTGWPALISQLCSRLHATRSYPRVRQRDPAFLEWGRTAESQKQRRPHRAPCLGPLGP